MKAVAVVGCQRWRRYCPRGPGCRTRGDPIAGAAEATVALRASGARVVFVTNEPLRRRTAVVVVAAHEGFRCRGLGDAPPRRLRCLIQLAHGLRCGCVETSARNCVMSF